MTTSPTSVRLSPELLERVRARAHAERRSFANTLRVLVEAGVEFPDEAAKLSTRLWGAEDREEEFASD